MPSTSSQDRSHGKLAQQLLAVSAGVDTRTGWMPGARQVPSPNFDARPGGILPELIVVHGISLPPDEYGGPWIDRLFTNSLPPELHPYFEKIKELKVSTHLLIRRDGELVQYVSIHDRAWHAGASCYQGRERCNDFSVGIELEGSDEVAYEPGQYRVLSAVILELCKAYPSLSPARVAGHSDIAPGRKTDPGPAFDWQRLHALLRAAG
ncbi:MAG TPA: 1,6-anhydro-N-acetylmuramyl-L-alanine amidase AmpD [Steroidobacter sp.]|uniref:1,6-anhydro-N-acetylmuramyl-L-alanine amidase AmpD n=1 Tax=Steroidobacter sp. TaxID=1978227 RepID=UPI002ED99F87